MQKQERFILQILKRKKEIREMIITIEEVAMIITALTIATMIQSALDFTTKKMHKKGIAS